MLSPFTVEAGLKMQREHLAEWEQRLSAKCWNALVAEVRIQNNRKLETGFDVFRGQDITSFVASWRPL